MNPLTLAAVLLATHQTATLQDKQKALTQPVCVLPYGQIIGLEELPKRAIAPAWMGRLKDETPVSLVSIPATHDAGTGLAKTGWTRCQVLNIPAQLAVGFRGFDVRLRLVDDQLGVYHNEESQQLTFQAVMDAFASYLAVHPKEFIVMRIREESQALNSTKTFEGAFEDVMNSSQYGPLFYHAKSRTEIPTVGRLRGKIFLLDNYGKLPDAVDYPNTSMSVQDDYDTSDMEKKYGEIIAKFQDALGAKAGDVWDVNYTSSSTMPVDQLANAKAVNAKVAQFLKGRKGHLGLVFTNFAGVDEIRSIYQSNF